MITQAELKNKLIYRNGILIWNIRPTSNVHIGDIAGYMINDDRYRGIRINNKMYLLHRIIFLHQKGYLPEFLDHIDGNTLNNRIENLRPATLSQNSQNSKMRNDNKSGIKGIHWCNREKKWIARIMIKNIRKNLGQFDDINKAETVLINERKVLHGEFCNHGKSNISISN